MICAGGAPASAEGRGPEAAMAASELAVVVDDLDSLEKKVRRIAREIEENENAL